MKKLVALSETVGQGDVVEDEICAAANQLSLQLRTAGASVTSALPGVPASFAVAASSLRRVVDVAAVTANTDYLLILLINAVWAGVKSYNTVVCILLACFTLANHSLK